MANIGKAAAVVIRGMVTSFDAVKGYGYVAQGGGRELFGEQLATAGRSPQSLALGEQVVFEVVQGHRGPFVSAVRRF